MKTGNPRLTITALACIALASATTLSGQISYHPITDDADSGIDSGKVYTHAVDFGSDSPRALINGVQFQAGGTTFGSITGTSATVGTGTTTVPSAHTGDGSADPFLNGASFCNMEDLMEDMNYNDATAEITLTGLTPGQSYRFRLYHRVWGSSTSPGSRSQDIGFDTDGIGTSIAEAEATASFNEDNASDPDPSFPDWWQVYAFTYEYTLSPGVTQLKVYINQTAGGTYHLYGLTNEEAGPDTNPPVISTLSPADDSTGAYPAGNLVATFNEDLALTGAGTVTLTDLSDGTGNVTINLPDARVSVAGNELTIDPSAALEFATGYEVSIDGSALADLADTPNAYGGTAAGEWTFTTAAQDLTAPVIVTTSPADDAADVVPGTDIMATFDDNIALGSGDIMLVDTTDATGTQTIAVTDTSQVSVVDNVLTINPAADLEPATVFAVQIDAGAVRNYSDVAFAGILAPDVTTWNFTTADTTTFTGPNKTNGDNWSVAGNWDVAIPSGALNAVIPAGKQVTSDGGGAVPYTGDLTLGGYLQIGWVNPRNLEDFNALGTPGTSTIFMGDGSSMHFRAGSWGTVDIPAIVLQGNASIRMNSSTEPASNFDFPYGINGPHTMTLFGKGGQDAILSAANSFSELVITSTEGSYDVFATAAGSLNGNVTLAAYNGLPAADLSIDAADAIADTATLSLNGATSATLITMNADDTIDLLVVNGFPYPAGTYGATGSGATYEVSWIAGPGILTVSSAPADVAAPLLVSFSPPDDTPDVFIAEWFNLEFNEPVVAGSGNILIKNLTDATTTAVSAADTLQVSISDNLLVIDLIANLAGGKNYAIQIEPTAFTDLFGNPYPGITDDTTWNFTTVNPKSLFSDDFESPDVTAAQSGSTGNGGTSKIADTAKWVRATQGYGASANGLEDEAAGFFTDPVGEQAYRFAYTNSGVTTAAGVIGSLLPGATYTVSFNVVADGTNGGTSWHVKLVAFEEGAARDDARNNNGTTVLRELNGNAPAGGAYEPQSFTFTVDHANATHTSALGKDLALRFIGATSSANIDNVVVSVAGETIAPTVVSIDDNVSGGPVNVPNPVVYTVTFDDWMNAASIGTDDFENGSTAGITVASVNATSDPAVYEVTVNTTSAGDLNLQIAAGAVIEDAAFNALDTSLAIPDDTTITVDSAATGAYNVWAATNAPSGTPEDDYDGDGVANAVEFVLGGLATTNDLDKLPAVATSGGDMTFTFVRDQNSADPSVSTVIEVGTDLATWPDTYTVGADTAGSTLGVTVTDNADGTDTVTLTVTQAPDAKKFARLKVIIN